MTQQLDALALRYPCLYCRAQPDEWCLTKSGARSTYLHSWRQSPVREAWLEGYHDGYQEHGRYTTQTLERIQ